MAIAGVVVVPYKKDMSEAIMDRLRAYEEVEVQDVGEQGIAAVMEAGDVRRLKDISEEIEGWDEVVEFNLAYLNWEDPQRGEKK
jgi:nitrate reductase NapAB chaperone NapD